MIIFIFVGSFCDFFLLYNTRDGGPKLFLKEVFKYVEEPISLSLSLLSVDFWTFHTGTRFYETTLSNVSPLSVSCFQPRPERKYRALSLARLATKLQRGHYTEVKHDAIFELRRRCLIASCRYRLAPSKYSEAS